LALGEVCKKERFRGTGVEKVFTITGEELRARNFSPAIFLDGEFWQQLCSCLPISILELDLPLFGICKERKICSLLIAKETSLIDGDLHQATSHLCSLMAAINDA